MVPFFIAVKSQLDVLGQVYLEEELTQLGP